MTTNEWAGLSVALLTLVTGFSGFVRWLVKHYLAELKPNSGSSLRDSVDRLEKRLDDLFMLVAGKNNE